MQNIYKYIIENVSSGTVKKETAVELLKRLKEKEDSKEKYIAVIGIAGKYPLAENKDEYWNNIKSGKDLVREFPESRKNDIDGFLKSNGHKGEIQYLKGVFLEEIDKFDYRFFKMSPMEASLMDPNQRLFLQTAYEAIEDSGYGGDQLNGTKTGVYIGYSNDLRDTYGQMIKQLDPALLPSSIAGNLSSILPSRISYFLNLKGPSILIDTACSSSLLSVHIACEAIKNKECDMALAGGMKINLMPLADGVKIGIESSDGRTKTFDESSDGTGIGEGIGVVILKGLKQAINDRDNIYAVIKGSAANQDGTSAGITAPNVESQTDVILSAWKNSGIDPKNISYIEAHGTGTKLGDPIEIDGLISAFRKYTTRKQFCGIGSVKSNIGHLYEGAGIASLIKCIMALKNRQLPPTLHFNMPNIRIPFENSPVYVNDVPRDWEKCESPRTCGVSSFGFSGTNVHLILEESPYQTAEECDFGSKELCEESSKLVCEKNPNLFVISAKSEASLKELVSSYKRYVDLNPAAEIDDICFTAAIGRGHYKYRLAMIVNSMEELKDKLNGIDTLRIDAGSYSQYFYGVHNLVAQDKKVKELNDITEEEQRELSGLAAREIEIAIGKTEKDIGKFKLVCDYYVKGANIDWNLLYKGNKRKRISLPVYPFEKKRCWFKLSSMESKQYIKIDQENIIHPLLEKCIVKSIEQDIYKTVFAPSKHFVLKDHVIMGKYVVPGTTYLEIAVQIGKLYYGESKLQLKNILFQKPVIIDGENEKEVQIIVKMQDSCLGLTVISQEEDTWDNHVSMDICTTSENENTIYNPDELKKDSKVVSIDQNQLTYGFINFGPRWLNYKKIYIKDDYSLASIALDDQFEVDINTYDFHPSLIDMAVNAVSLTLGERYLPLSYRKFNIYGKTPKQFYSLIKRKTSGGNTETIVFDVLLLDMDRKVFAHAEDYVIKKVYGSDNFLRGEGVFHNIKWVEDLLPEPIANYSNENNGVLLFADNSGKWQEMFRYLEESGTEVIVIQYGSGFERIDNNKYIIGYSQEDFDLLINSLNGIPSDVIYMPGIQGSSKISDINELERSMNEGIYGLFHFTRAIQKQKINEKINVLVVADYVYEVTKEQDFINPLGASLFALAKTISAESLNIKCRCLDIDSNTSDINILKELFNGKKAVHAIRSGVAYVEELDKYDIEEVPSAQIELKEDGIYIITGGTGGIGLEICKYLSKNRRVRLALINRSKLPERENWKNTNEFSDKVKKIIEAVIKVEENGSKVELLSADVSNEKEMSGILESLRAKYGRINGVIHGAGVAGDGFIMNKDEKVFKDVLKPKIYGTFLLDRLTENDNLDFFIMFSSVAALIGIPGQSDYSSGNAYMDAYASLRSKRNLKTLSINWPAWKETGMAVDYKSNFDSMFRAIPTALALEAFQAVIHKDLNRVIIGEINYKAPEWQRELPINIGKSIKKAVDRNKDKKSAQSHIRTDIVVSGKGEDSYDEIELKVSALWANVLGLEEINVYESFYELGGDSIMATRLHKEIDKEYPGVLDITDVFSYSTISKMAEYIKNKMGYEGDTKTEETIKTQGFEEDDKTSGNNSNNLEEMLEKLARGEISASEVDEMIGLGGE